MPKKQLKVEKILIALIDPNPDQGRIHYDPDSLSELAESIAKVGLINPITLSRHNDRFILQAGSRRLEAHRLLQKEFILSIVINVDTSTGLSTMLHENLFRTDLSPYEESVMYVKLRDQHKYELRQICHLTNKPESYVIARLNLATLPDVLQTLVHDGKLPISHALTLGQIDDETAMLQYVNYAVETGANLQTVRYWKQQYFASKSVPTQQSNGQPIIIPPVQFPSFGWNCFVCQNHTEASQCSTLHICPDCFEVLLKAVQGIKK